MRRASVWAVVVGIAVMLGVATLGLVAYRRHQRGQIETASHTAIEAVRRAAKLATVEMQVSNWHLRRDAKDLFGFIPIKCEKTVAVFYRGTVAAGFDLGPAGAMTVEVDTDPGTGGRRVHVRLPPPRILYLDVPAPDLVVADGSMCNQVEPSDYARMHTDVRATIERDAIAGGILARAEKHGRELVEAVVQPMGFPVTITVSGDASIATGVKR